MLYSSLWTPKRLEPVFDHKWNHFLDATVKLGFCLSKDIGQGTSLDFGNNNISLTFERFLYKKLVKIPRGFEVLKMIHQSPKVLTKTRVSDFIKVSWEFWSGTSHMASICLEDHMLEVLTINFEGKRVNWFRGVKWSFCSTSVKVKVEQVNF